MGKVIDMILSRPSKATVNTPDSLDGMWGSMLRKYEWARVVNQEMGDVAHAVGRVRRRTGKFFKPIFSFKWVPKMPKMPEIPVHEKMKAQELATSMQSARANGTKLVTLDEGKDRDAEEFWKHIPGDWKLFGSITLKRYSVKDSGACCFICLLSC